MLPARITSLEEVYRWAWSHQWGDGCVYDMMVWLCHGGHGCVMMGVVVLMGVVVS